MKNKKLFAILTLVCFMFTLMPVAAFAATTDYVGVADTAKDTVSVEIGGDPLEVAVFDVNEEVVTGSEYFFWAEDADENVVALGDGASFEFKDAGTFYVFAAADLPDGVITSSMTKAAAVALIKDRYNANIVDDALTVKVKKADTVYSFAPVADVEVTANDNWTEVETTVTLFKNSDTPVKNADIKFTADSAYVTIEKVEKSTTDRNGEQVIRVTAAKAGNYVIYADYEDAETLEIDLTVLPARVSGIKTVAEPARGVALDSSFARGLADIGFEITTADGTLVDGSEGLVLADVVDYKVTVIEAPADSDIDEEELTLAWDSNNDRWMLQGATSLDEEGTYTFKVALRNGGSATATAKVVEFDKPIMMSLIMNEKTVALVGGEAATVKTVVFVDKNGTTLSAAHGDYTKYAGSRIMDGRDVIGYTGIDYAGSGKAIANVDPVTGAVSTVAYNSDTKALVGTKVTITAVNDKLEMTASADLTVVNNAAALKYETTSADVAVNNKLIVNTVDEEGNVVSANLDEETVASVYVLSAPTDAAYSVSADVTDNDEVTVTFTASVAGEYKLQTIVRNDGKYYSSVDVITVGGVAGEFNDIVVVSMGANSMIVNNKVVALDVAPFITEGRTMLQFNVLGAFGIDVQWDEATRSVIAEGNGVKVVLTIDSKVAVVNGQEVTLDVAPTIANGRTVVPVGFITGNFGINPTFTYNADGTIADILFTK